MKFLYGSGSSALSVKITDPDLQEIFLCYVWPSKSAYLREKKNVFLWLCQILYRYRYELKRKEFESLLKNLDPDRSILNCCWSFWIW
jgi:hypothetical protein